MSSQPGMSRNDQRRVALAARAAANSDCKHSLGAILVAGGRVMAAASNRHRNTAQVAEHENCTEHAEEAILRLAGDAALGATVYVTRINRQGNLLESRPCVRCHQQLVAAGVRRVVYTNTHGTIVSFKPQHSNVPEPRKRYEIALLAE